MTAANPPFIAVLFGASMLVNDAPAARSSLVRLFHG
jgi:hypothetical protein